jgi:two-component system response regulator VanR
MRDLERLKEKSILLVEDEVVIRTNIVATLRFFFKEVYSAKDGFDGLTQAQRYLPDIIMSDLKMPSMGGLEMLQRLKASGNDAYMIILSAHTDTDLLLQALHQGVDRYIVKPLDERRLFESFDAYLEAHRPLITPLTEHLTINLESHHIIKKQENLPLSPKEARLLKLLLTNQHRVYSYAEIEDYVWGENSMSLSALRSVVRDLRKKLGKRYVHNRSMIGYCFLTPAT